jgi:hypothetical protein
LQGGYELRPGYEGVAVSDDGLTWRRAKNQPILSVHDPDCGTWEKDCIYQPWLVEHRGRFFNFYNAAEGGIEQMGVAFSTDLLNWMRYPANPVLAQPGRRLRRELLLRRQGVPGRRSLDDVLLRRGPGRRAHHDRVLA